MNENENHICKHFALIEGKPCCTLGWRGVEARNEELKLPSASFPSGIQLVFAEKKFTDPAGGMQDFFWWKCAGNHNNCNHSEFEEVKEGE